MKPNNITKYLVNCGYALIGFTVIYITVFALLRPEYSHLHHTISELGETGAVNISLVRASFIICGILEILFAIGLFRSFKHIRGAWLGALFIGLHGLFDDIGSGIFPCDPGAAVETFSGIMHAVVSCVGGLAMILAPFFYFNAFKKHDEFDKLKQISLSIGFLTIVLFLITGFAINYHFYGGLIQRIFVIVYFYYIYTLMKTALKNLSPPI